MTVNRAVKKRNKPIFELMKKKYNWTPYIILFTILVTLGVQLYWNYYNYLTNEQGFKNEVQNALDNAVSTYYNRLTEQKNVTLVSSLDTVQAVRKSNKIASEEKINKVISAIESDLPEHISVFQGEKSRDSLRKLHHIKAIYISINKDSINFLKLNNYLQDEFQRRKYSFPYALKHYKADTVFEAYNQKIISPKYLSTTTTSTHIKENEKLELLYPNAVQIILKKSLLGVFVSLLLAIAIIVALFYLLRIIKQQKQLSEIKEDLVSNITHEFKTPITTIGTALESIQYFNAKNNQDKTKQYLDLSQEQLVKLTEMVEKLMDTALFDSETLVLNLQVVNIFTLVQKVIDKFEVNSNKHIVLNAEKFEPETITADIFQLENALGNILDNAIKYGGDHIKITLVKEAANIKISISDNGKTLLEDDLPRVFEKFYRLSTGNVHNVKGYGIGLYHTKKIIEKHNGSIEVFLRDNLTTFIITLPYA